MEKLISVISNIGDFFSTFTNGVLDFISFLVSIVGFIRYAGKTLIIGVYKLFLRVLDSSVFVNVSQAFLNLSDYIGFGAYFIYALMFVIIVRIIIAFVFKILRLNLDYHSLNSKTGRRNKSDNVHRTISKVADETDHFG